MSSTTPRDDEKTCIDAYLYKLGEATGRPWRVDRWLDAAFQDVASPECIVTDGESDRAVEVKDLYDEESPRVVGNVRWLERRLADVPGTMIMLPRAYRGRHLSPPMQENVESEISRVAPGLTYGSLGYIRVYHRSRLTQTAPQNSVVFCDHGFHEWTRQAAGQVSGLFHLHDKQTAGEVHTEEAQRELKEIIIDACNELSVTGESQKQVEWFEEWCVYRLKGTGADVSFVVSGWAGPEVIRGLLKEIVRSGNAKFAQRRWAPTHVLLI